MRRDELGRTPDTRHARARDIFVRDILGQPVTEAERAAAANWIASARRGSESRPFNLKAAMEKRGVTTYALAETLGVSRRTITRWRSGHSRPTKTMARRIADALKLPPLRVVTGLAGQVRISPHPSVVRKYDPSEPLTGQNLAAARRKAGMTQREVAAEAKVSEEMIHRLERGKSRSSDHLRKVQKVVRARLGK